MARVKSSPHEVQLSVTAGGVPAAKNTRRKNWNQMFKEDSRKPEIGRIWMWSSTDAVG